MTTQTSRIPVLGEDGRFPDAYAPASVALDAQAAAQAKADAQGIADGLPAAADAAVASELAAQTPGAVAAEIAANLPPVQQVTLAGDLAYTLPAGAPADRIVSVVFTQTTGGHTVTYGPDTLAIDTDPGASTLVEIWPEGEVIYPGATGEGPTTLDDLSDVSTAGATTGQALVRQSNGTWAPGNAIPTEAGGVAGVTPLSKLTPHRTRQYVAEYLAGPKAGKTKTLVDIPGAGTVTSLFCVFNLEADPDRAGSCRLQVLVDGESVPSIDVELSVLILSGLGAADQNPSINQGFGHLHVETINGDYQSFTLLYPIPYANGCVVRIYNPTDYALDQYGHFMWCVAATTPEQSPLRLRSSSVPLAANHTVTSLDAYQFVDLNTGGWMVYHALLGTGTGRGWMERNIDIYVDHESVSSMPSTGLEDYFRSSNYFLNATGTGRRQYSTPFSLVTNISGSTCAVGLDWLALAGGVKFTTGLRVVLQSEQGRDGAASVNPFGWLILWYEDPSLAPPPDTTAPVWSATLTPATPTETSVVVAASELATDANAITYERTLDSTTGTPDWAAIVPSGLDFTLSRLTPSTVYGTCGLRARDAAGNVSPTLAVPSFTTAVLVDSTPPSVGMMTASLITQTGFTLTVSGASDAGGSGLHVQPYDFSINGTWTGYQESPVYVATGKTQGTEYSCAYRVRDAVGNVSTGVSRTVTTAVPAPPLADAILALNPIGYWKLNETSGTQAVDSSGNNRHGTYSGSFTQAGQDGYVKFNGIGHVSVPSDAAFSAATSGAGLTVFALAYVPSGSPAGPGGFIQSQQWEFGIYGDVPRPFARFYGDINGYTCPNSTYNAWRSYAMTIPHLLEGQQGVLGTYLDKAKYAPASTTIGGHASAPTTVSIGNRLAYGDWPSFWGVAHVAVFSTELTAEQIAGLVDSARSEGLIAG